MDIEKEITLFQLKKEKIIHFFNSPLGSMGLKFHVKWKSGIRFVKEKNIP